ncbi:MAG: hypothetical protein FGM28_04910 [Limnohabitans sp.]|nr:hypothetical protein [Limnohabitans sp.]
MPLRHLSGLTARLLITLCIAWAPTGVSAQQSIRPEIGKALQDIQNLLASDAQQALQKAQSLTQSGELRPSESLLLDRLWAVAAIRTQKHALALERLEALLSRADISAEDRRQFLVLAVQVSQALKAWDKVQLHAQTYQSLGGDAAAIQLALLQAFVQTDRYDLLQSWRKRTYPEGMLKVSSEAELRLLALGARRAKDWPDLVQAMQALVTRYPKPEYWLDLLSVLENHPRYQARYKLDLGRLMRVQGVLEDEEDILEMAQAAYKLGLPFETVDILERAARQVKFSADAARASDELLRAAKARAQEDLKTLKPPLPTDPQSSAHLQWALVLLSQGEWNLAADFFARALALGELRRPDEVRLHYGVALIQAGRVDAALQYWQKMPVEDDFLRLLAELWKLKRP